MSYYITGTIHRVKESKTYNFYHVSGYDVKNRNYKNKSIVGQIELNRKDVLLKENTNLFTLHRSDRMVFNIEIPDEDLTSKHESSKEI